MKRLYLDSCILIAYYSTHKEEREKKKEVKRILDIFENLQIECSTSHWAIAEMINILLSRHKIRNETVLKFESELLNKSRLGNLKIGIVEIEGKNKKYDIKEFFMD